MVDDWDDMGDIEGWDDIDDFDLGGLDDKVKTGSKLEDVQVGASPGIGSRKPVMDFASGVGEALTSVSLDRPAVGMDIALAFPSTNSLVETATDTISDLERIRVNAVKDLAPSMNQLKQAGRRILPQVKNILPKRIYDKVYSKLEPETPDNAQTGDGVIDDGRSSLVAQEMHAIFEAQQSQDAADVERARADDYVKSSIERSEHQDTAGLLSSINAQAITQTKFTNTALKGYLMKSLELKYRHLFVAQDTLAATKLMAKSFEDKLEAIATNTGLPEIQKKRKFEAIKEFQQQILLGKAAVGVGEWTRTFRTKLMANIGKKVGEVVTSIKEGAEEAAGMANQYVDMEEMDKEFADDDFGDEDEDGNPIKKAAVPEASVGKKIGRGLGSLAVTHLGKKVMSRGVQAMGQYGVDADNMAGSIKRNTMFGINDMLRNTENPFLRWLGENVVPRLEVNRGRLDKTLSANALEEIPFDVLTRRSIIEIIPGFLSKILTQTTNIATGRDDAEEMVFDPHKEDFVTATKFKEDIKKRYFGTKDSRTSDMAEGVGKLLGAYSMHGGDEAEFYSSMEDVVKFINNSAKHAQKIRPKDIAKLAKGESLDTDYEDLVFADVSDKEKLIKLLNQAFHDEEGGVNRDIENDLDIFAKRLGASRDEQMLPRLRAANGLGTRRLHDEFMNEKGELDHNKIRAQYADVDIDSLKASSHNDAKDYLSVLQKREQGRFLSKNKIDTENIHSTQDDIDATIAAINKVREDIESGEFGRDPADGPSFKSKTKKQGRKRHMYETDSDPSVKTTEEETTRFKKRTAKLGREDIDQEAIQAKLAKDIADLKKDGDEDISDPIIKDSAHVSGPGIYVQGSKQEMHLPLDKESAFWTQLASTLKGVDFNSEVITAIQEAATKITEGAGKTDSKGQEALTAIKEALETHLPKLNMNMEGVHNFIASGQAFGAQAKGFMGKAWGHTKTFGGKLVTATGDIVKGTGKGFGKVLPGAGQLAGKALGGAGTLLGATAGAAGSIIGGFGNAVGSSLGGTSGFMDVLPKGGDKPLITVAQLLKGLKFASGKPVKNVHDISEPVIDPETGEELITQAQIDAGLRLADGRALLGRAVGGTMRLGGKALKGVGTLSGKALGLAGKGIGFGGQLVGKGLKVLPDMYKDMFGLATGALRGAGGMAKGLFNKVLGIGDGGGLSKKSVKRLISDRLDKIYTLLDKRLAGKIAGDIDGDGDRDGSYADREAEEAKPEETVNKPKRLSDRLKLGAASLLGALRPGAKGEEDKGEGDDDGESKGPGMVSTMLGTLAGGKALSWIKGKWADRKAAKAAKAAAKAAGEVVPKTSLMAKLGTKAANAKDLIKGKWLAGAGSRAAAKVAATTAIKNKAEVIGGAATKYGTKLTTKFAEKKAAWAASRAAKVAAKDAAKIAAKQAVKKSVVKGLGKSLLKKIPVLGALAGMGFATKRAFAGDFTGAGMEAASGAASLLPGLGTAGSVAIDAALMARDVKKGMDKSKADEAAKLAPTPINVKQNKFTKSDRANVGLVQAPVSHSSSIVSKIRVSHTDSPQTTDLAESRFEAYGVRTEHDIIDEIEQLESWAYNAYIKEDTKPDQEALQKQALLFGFDHNVNDEYAYFNTWFKHRFLPVFKLFNSILTTRYNCHFIEANSLSEDDQADVLETFANAVTDIRCNKNIIPTRAAYDKYITGRNQKRSTMEARKRLQMQSRVTTGEDTKDLTKAKLPDDKNKSTDPNKAQVTDETGQSRSSDDTSGSAPTSTQLGTANSSIAGGNTRGLTKEKVSNNYDPELDTSDDTLGSVSAKYESSTKGSTAIGYDGKGGTSYGKYQIASKTGTFAAFLKWCSTQPNGKLVADRLRAAGEPNTGSKQGAVPAEWLKLVSEGAMGQLEHEFIKATHYTPAMKGIRNQEFVDRITKSRTLQDALWSTAVQHGGGGASGIFNQAYNADLDDANIIRRIYQIRSTKFGSSTPDVKQSVMNRFQKEENDLIAMAERQAETKEDLTTANTVASSSATPGSTSGSVLSSADSGGSTAGPTGDSSTALVSAGSTGGAAKLSSAITEPDKYAQPVSAPKVVANAVVSAPEQVAKQAEAKVAAAAPAVASEDTTMHKLSGDQVSELKQVNANISRLASQMETALGNGSAFTDMNKYLKTVAEKDPVVNVDARQIAANSGGNKQAPSKPQYQGISMSKGRNTKTGTYS